MKRRRRGFTLVEIMVVVTIIVILVGITVAIGLNVKTKTAVNATKNTLHTLDGLMKNYAESGNIEPGLPTAAQPLPPPLTDPTDQTLWVIALRSTPEGARAIQSMKLNANGDMVLDNFGKPIRYIPYATVYNSGTPGTDPGKKQGYFWSSGPDGVFNSAGAASGDDIFSSMP